MVSLLKDRYAAVAKIETVDPRTVKFTMKEPSAIFLLLLTDTTQGIYAKKTLDDNNNDLRKVLVAPGTGPFMFKEYKDGEKWTLVRNPNYWNKELPYIDQLELVHVAAWSDRFLMVGRRLDIDLTYLYDFDDPSWQQRLKTQARRDGELKSEVWIDWFVFSRGLFKDLPEFAIGRSGYDNWLLWRAATEGAPLIDATGYVPLIHQRHDYSHAGGKTRVWEGEEARRAHELVGHWRRYYSVSHAGYMLTSEGDVVPARGLRYRLARPRRLASHVLRFTRPLRRRLQGQRATWRRSKA